MPYQSIDDIFSDILPSGTTGDGKRKRKYDEIDSIFSDAPSFKPQQKIESTPISSQQTTTTQQPKKLTMLTPSHASTLTKVDDNPDVTPNFFRTRPLTIRKNDNPVVKGLKGAGNVLSDLVDTPGEVLGRLSIQAGSLLSGHGLKKDSELPRDVTFTRDILLPATSEKYQNQVKQMQQNNPGLATAYEMLVGGAADPMNLVGGGSVKALTAPKILKAEAGMAKVAPIKSTLKSELPLAKTDELVSVKPQLTTTMQQLPTELPAQPLKPVEITKVMAESTGLDDAIKTKLSTLDNIKVKADSAISHLDQVEANAWARYNANKGRVMSGIPVDQLADIAIIGGVKIAKGAIKFSVWSAEMVATFGDDVKPHLDQLWQKSKEIDGGFKRMSFPDTVANAEITTPEMQKFLKEMDFDYKVKANADTLEVAKQELAADKAGSLREILSDYDATPEMNTKALLLYKDALDSGDVNLALDIVSKISEKAKNQGQAIQSLSMWGRLMPEGILRYADKTMKKAGKKLNETTAKDLLDQANDLQKMPEGRQKQVKTAKLLEPADFVALAAL